MVTTSKSRTRTVPSRTRKTPVPLPAQADVPTGTKPRAGGPRLPGLWGVAQRALKGIDPTVKARGSSGAAVLGAKQKGPQPSSAAQGRSSGGAGNVQRAGAPPAPTPKVPRINAAYVWHGPGGRPAPAGPQMIGSARTTVGGMGAVILPKMPQPKAPVGQTTRTTTQPGQTSQDQTMGKRPITPKPKAPKVQLFRQPSSKSPTGSGRGPRRV